MEEGTISQGHTPDGREDCGWRGCLPDGRGDNITRTHIPDGKEDCGLRGCSGFSDTCQCACRRESLECHTDRGYPSVSVVQPSC